jgi:hypothetical protein
MTEHMNVPKINALADAEEEAMASTARNLHRSLVRDIDLRR